MSEPQIVTLARGDLAVWTFGEGSDVLVLHGFPDDALLGSLTGHPGADWTPVDGPHHVARLQGGIADDVDHRDGAAPAAGVVEGRGGDHGSVRRAREEGASHPRDREYPGRENHQDPSGARHRAPIVHRAGAARGQAREISVTRPLSPKVTRMVTSGSVAVLAQNVKALPRRV